MAYPKVSVVVPVHNGRASLRRTFQSVFDQSLPPGDIEIIAVNDGSTDGSGEELERLAAEHPRFTVIHQAASGGPGKPRNVGIEQASGEYVFFLDADDHLGPEALERCAAMADAHGTDVVVPKYVGVGRKVNPHLFKRTVGFTTIYDAVPNLYGSITALKMYRRELLERCAIRFPEEVLSGEDQIFAVRAYFEAKGVSVLADYDCYYWVDRADGSSALQVGGAPAHRYFPEISRLMEFVGERTSPGPVRDRLMRRHFAYEVFSRFDPRYMAFSEDERRATKDAARELVLAWSTPDIAAGLGPYTRLIDHALRHGLDGLIDAAARVHATDPPALVLDGRHAYRAYPGFRDPELNIPDAVFEVTGPFDWRRGLTGVEWRDGHLVVRGFAYIEQLDDLGGADHSVRLILRERDGGGEHRVPFRPAGGGSGGSTELAAEIDLATVAGGGPLPPGRWDLHAELRVLGHDHTGRLMPGKGVEVAMPGGRIAPVAKGTPIVTPYLTKGVSALALHVGGTGGQNAPTLPVATAPRPDGRVRLTAELATILPPDAPVEVRAVLRHRVTRVCQSAGMTVERHARRLHVTADLDLSGARRGQWDLWYEVTSGATKGTVRGAATERLQGDRANRPYRTIKGNLTIDVAGRWYRRLRNRG